MKFLSDFNSIIYISISELFCIFLVWWLNYTLDVIFLITMKLILVLTVVYFFQSEGAVLQQEKESTAEGNQVETLNERPIIGILAIDQSWNHVDKYKNNYTSYIAASYVKALEASGARVVPIMIGKKREYYESLLGKLNGVLFPGGSVYFNDSGYADAAEHIYDIAQQLNNRGQYLPIFGTCLGFEILIILALGRKEKDNRINCYSNGNTYVEFNQDFRDSKMFHKVPENIVNILSKENSTVNHHQFCITDEGLKVKDLYKDWKVLSHSYDKNGIKFVSSVENNRYPFYGVQFHPEKAAYEWKNNKHYNHVHTTSTILANRYFMDFFVNECRKSNHSFLNDAEENEYLIYNYDPKFTLVKGSAFTQCYMFEPTANVKMCE